MVTKLRWSWALLVWVLFICWCFGVTAVLLVFVEATFDIRANAAAIHAINEELGVVTNQLEGIDEVRLSLRKARLEEVNPAAVKAEVLEVKRMVAELAAQLKTN